MGYRIINEKERQYKAYKAKSELLGINTLKIYEDIPNYSLSDIDFTSVGNSNLTDVEIIIPDFVEYYYRKTGAGHKGGNLCEGKNITITWTHLLSSSLSYWIASPLDDLVCNTLTLNLNGTHLEKIGNFINDVKANKIIIRVPHPEKLSLDGIAEKQRKILTIEKLKSN